MDALDRLSRAAHRVKLLHAERLRLSTQLCSGGAAKLAAHRAAIVEACEQIAEQRERIDSIVETAGRVVAQGRVIQQQQALIEDLLSFVSWRCLALPAHVDPTQFQVDMGNVGDETPGPIAMPFELGLRTPLQRATESIARQSSETPSAGTNWTSSPSPDGEAHKSPATEDGDRLLQSMMYDEAGPPGAPLNLRKIDCSAASVRLEWDPPCERRQSVLGYELHYGLPVLPSDAARLALSRHPAEAAHVEWATPLMVLAREDGPIDAEISDLSCGDYALRCRAFNGYGEGPFSTVVRFTLGAAQRCCLPLNSSEQLSGEGSEQLPSTQGEELFLARIGPATILALWQTPALADSDIIALQLQRLDLGSSDIVRDDAIGWEDADVVRIDRLVPDLCCQVDEVPSERSWAFRCRPVRTTRVDAFSKAQIVLRCAADLDAIPL